jgi:hypothetical protein
MHAISTLKELNEAAAASQEKAAWPAPVAAENTESVDTQVGSAPPLPDTPAISRVDQLALDAGTLLLDKGEYEQLEKFALSYLFLD